MKAAALHFNKEAFAADFPLYIANGAADNSAAAGGLGGKQMVDPWMAGRRGDVMRHTADITASI